MADSWERFIVNVDEVRQIYDEILNIRETCATIARQTQDVAWIAVGQAVARIQENFTSTLNEIARITALAATREIRAALRAKMLRDPTGHSPGLAQSIFSEHVVTGNFSFGQVEVAHLDKLDEAISPTSSRPYWRSQEFGSSHNVGRSIFGVFEGGGGTPGPPDPTQFRQHPVFTPGIGSLAGPGTIKRRIPPKHFLRDGTDVAKNQWLVMVRTAVQATVAQINQIQFPETPVPRTRLR